MALAQAEDYSIFILKLDEFLGQIDKRDGRVQNEFHNVILYALCFHSAWSKGRGGQFHGFRGYQKVMTRIIERFFSYVCVFSQVFFFQ